jgi:hypothetical protein
MDEFEKPELTVKEERYRNNIQSLIEYCLYCQPYDEGEPVWIHGDRIELYELMEDCNIPDNNQEKIAQNLFCPYCGNESFDLTLDVGVKTKFDKDVDKHLGEARRIYGKEIKGLERLLEQYPLLAYQNRLAKRIYKEIKNKKLPVISIGGNFFRSRKMESSEIINSHKMYNPSLGKPTEGRFNHAGQSHLYLASDKITAIKEVISGEHSLLVWCQEFKISVPVSDILDLSFNWDYLTPSTSTLLLSLKMSNAIERNDRNTENWKPDYYLTRYIMDCAKSAGYNGIKYNSTKQSVSYDLVLFYPEKIKIKTIGNPSIEIFLNKKEKKKFTSDLFDTQKNANLEQY